MRKKRRPVPPAPTSREQFYRRLLGSRDKRDLVSLAKAHGLARKTLTWWAWELGRRERARGEVAEARVEEGIPAVRTDRLRFLPVRVVPSAGEDRPRRAAAASGLFEVRLRGGHEISIPQAFDAEGLRRLLSVLEESTC